MFCCQCSLDQVIEFPPVLFVHLFLFNSILFFLIPSFQSPGSFLCFRPELLPQMKHLLRLMPMSCSQIWRRRQEFSFILNFSFVKIRNLPIPTLSSLGQHQCLCNTFHLSLSVGCCWKQVYCNSIRWWGFSCCLVIFNSCRCHQLSPLGKPSSHLLNNIHLCSFLSSPGQNVMLQFYAL